MPTLFESDVELLLPLLVLRGFQELLGDFGLAGVGVGIHNTHVVNDVLPLRPEVSDKDTPLQPFFLP